MLQENVALIKEINELRREIKMLKCAAATGGVGAATGDHAATGAHARELQMQRDMIDKLRDEIKAKEERIAALEPQIMPRPMSRERLPPMDGFAPAPAEVAAQ